MNPSAEIENIVDQSVQLARELEHEYVTTEHLTLAMVRHVPFRKCLAKYGIDVEQLDQDLLAYIVSLVSLVRSSVDIPKKTSALERVFNRANVQVMFTGRRSLSVIDVFLSIMSESNSHAQYFMLNHGMKKSEFVEFWHKNYQPATEAKMSTNQADEVLNTAPTSQHKHKKVSWNP